MTTRRLLCLLLSLILLIPAGLAETYDPSFDAPMTAEAGIASEDDILIQSIAVDDLPEELDDVDLDPEPADEEPSPEVTEIEDDPFAEAEDAETVVEDEPTVEQEPEDQTADDADAGQEPEDQTADDAAAEQAPEDQTADDADAGQEPEDQTADDADAGQEPEDQEAADDAPEALLSADVQTSDGDVAEAEDASEVPLETQSATAQMKTAAAAVAATGLTAPSLSLVIGVGESVGLNVTPQPAGATCALTYRVGKKKIASVSKDGIVKGKRKGKTSVTVTSDKGHKLTIKVRVVKAPKYIHMNRHGVNIASGETTTLTYTLYGGRTSVRFSSSNPDVASVNATTGVVTGIKTGSAVITARTANGKRATCRINVNTDGNTAPKGRLEVTFMNIGRNDGILLCCDGEYAFFDSGMHPQGVTAKKYLLRRGITHLKYYVGTHGHEDHLGGAPVILEALDVDTVIVPHKRCITRIKHWAHGAAERAATKAVKYRIMKVDQEITLGGATLRCLGPLRTIKVGAKDGLENRNSLVLRVTHGSNSFLLTGDALGGEFVDMQKHNPGCLRSTVMKNPHHDGMQRYGIKLAKPKIVVVSTSSKRNPPSSYVNWIKRRGCKVYITSSNRHGHVTIYSDGSNLTVKTQRTPKKK